MTEEIGSFVPILQQLCEDGQPYFLEGGQAVNFWAEYFGARYDVSELENLRPFTSKDCDIWIGKRVLDYMEARSDGVLIRGSSPADGQVGIFKTKENPPKTIDLLQGVYGIPPDKIQRVNARALNVSHLNNRSSVLAEMQMSLFYRFTTAR